MAILALLVMPWIFSAFGAVDVTRGNKHVERTEAVFQVSQHSIL
jgi:hypothetical protein